MSGLRIVICQNSHNHSADHLLFAAQDLWYLVLEFTSYFCRLLAYVSKIRHLEKLLSNQERLLLMLNLMVYWVWHIRQ